MSYYIKVLTDLFDNDVFQQRTSEALNKMLFHTSNKFSVTAKNDFALQQSFQRFNFLAQFLKIGVGGNNLVIFLNTRLWTVLDLLLVLQYFVFVVLQNRLLVDCVANKNFVARVFEPVTLLWRPTGWKWQNELNSMGNIVSRGRVIS